MITVTTSDPRRHIAPCIVTRPFAELSDDNPLLSLYLAQCVNFGFKSVYYILVCLFYRLLMLCI